MQKLSQLDSEKDLVESVILKVGLGDGYLYVLSISNGAVYRILPNVASTTTFSDELVEEQGFKEEDNNQPTVLLDEEQVIPNGNDDHENSDTTNNESQCRKLEDRIGQIEEQEDRDGLDKEQADELRNRIESIQNSLDCE